MLTESLIFMFASVCLYGVGLNRAVVLSMGKKGLVLAYIKSLFSSVATVALSYLLVQALLVPANLQELYPMICVLIFGSIAAFFEVLVQLTAKTDVAELSVSFICILLAINESISMAEAVIFVLCCITAFYAIIPILYAVRKRNESSEPVTVFKNSLILFSLAALILVLLVIDASWLSGGISR